MDGLIESNPGVAGVAPLPRPVERHDDAPHYYAVHGAIALEEARAALAQAVARGGAIRRRGSGGGGGGRGGRGNPRVKIRLAAVAGAGAAPGAGLVASGGV